MEKPTKSGSEKNAAQAWANTASFVPMTQAVPPTVPGDISTDPDVPSELLGHRNYKILRKLGEGGMGAVFLAEHLLMGRRVVLKVIRQELLAHPDVLARFFAEVKATAQLSHENIVRANSTDEVNGLHFLELEYVDGVNLSEYVWAKGPLPVRLACDLVLQAALGLHYAHQKGILHRDIKPGNLMVTREGRVKILDFGLARLGWKEPASGGLTKSGACMGTLEYLAPEQAFDASRADVRSDVYSLGCTLWFLLTGKPPFEGTDAVMQRIEGELMPLHECKSELPAALSAVAARLLASKPEDRYQSALEAAEALEPFARQGTTWAIPVVQPPDTPGRLFGEKPTAARGLRRAAGGIFVVAFLLIALGVFVFRGFVAGGKDRPTNSEKEVAEPPATFVNAAGGKMLRIPEGNFLRGSDEKPLREIGVSSFYLGATEVTQRQYREIMGSNPSYFSTKGSGKDKIPAGEDTDEYPVECVSWEEAKEFCRRLNAKDTKKPAGWEYRLPTEAEWEYACRAGTKTKYHTGDSENDLKNAGWYEGNTSDKPQRVAQKKPNAFGIYDMHGNVWEWCEDWYGENYYRDSPKYDPAGPHQGATRVSRGGSCRFSAEFSRSAYRCSTMPEGRANDVGFRVALVPAARDRGK
jgi:eukaryotic-like serine/threonine-protein kinase